MYMEVLEELNKLPESSDVDLSKVIKARKEKAQ